MTRQDKMLQLVLADERLMIKYDIDPDKYLTLHDALYSEDPIVSSIAMIIDSVKGDFEKSDINTLYSKIQRHLNDTLLI